jgi:hypothetical protein
MDIFGPHSGIASHPGSLYVCNTKIYYRDSLRDAVHIATAYMASHPGSQYVSKGTVF